MMKIVHVIIAAAYKEGYGYQENILPAKHVELGLETHVVSYSYSNLLGCEYVNDDGVKVCLLPVNKSVLRRVRFFIPFTCRTSGLYTYLDKVEPDIIFVHGLQSIDSLIIYRWCKKHPKVTLYVDQHADYYNSPINNFSTRMYYKLVFGYIAYKLSKYTKMFWGVTPWRVDYMQKIYRIKPEKTDLLVMGGDEKLIQWENRFEIRNSIRDRYGIPYDAFLIVTGGKIDKAKNIHYLIEAVHLLTSKNVYLLVFGNFEKDMESYCTPILKNNVQYIGWLDSKQVYQYFLTSDLVVFPGTHSVLWEQAVSCGVPGIFKDWNGGFNHVDCGGNAILLKDITVKSLFNVINDLIENKVKYNSMRVVAENIARKQFSYIEIARKSIGFE